MSDDSRNLASMPAPDAAGLSFSPAGSGPGLSLPFAGEGVRAGFPSPAQDYMDDAIDLNRELVRHPESTFYARVRGDSMIEADVREGDILVVDKSLEPRDGDLAVCVLDGEFTLKHLEIRGGRVRLMPANAAYAPICVGPDQYFEVWGVVTYVIRRARRRAPAR